MRSNTMKAALVFMFAVTAVAQPPAKAPDVPAPLVTKVFKAQAEMLAAQATARDATAHLQDKTAALQSVVAELRKACGDKFEPQLSQSGDPVCVAKAVQPTKAK